MPRVAPTITVSDDDRIVLLRWSKGRRTPARLVRRATIVLRAAEGWQNRVIAVELDIREKTVGLWRRRFAEQGTAGIERDASRRGRPATVQRGAVEAEVVRKTTRERPPTLRTGARGRWRPSWASARRASGASGSDTG